MIIKNWKEHIENLNAIEPELSFPQYIFDIREMYGINRSKVAESIGIRKSKLFLLEYGYFCEMPSDDILSSLATFYDISYQLLKNKCRHFCDEKMKMRCKSARDKVRSMRRQKVI